MRFFQTAVAAVLTVVATLAAANAPAKRDAQRNADHGTRVADAYREFDNLDSTDPHVPIAAEQPLTKHTLAAIDGREPIKQRPSGQNNVERYSPPQRYADQYFYTHNDGTKNQAVLYVAASPDAVPRVLLDPNTLSKDGSVALKRLRVSDDGTHVAYALASAGSDWEEWHVLDVESGKPGEDVLKGVKSSEVTWRRDGTGFFYARYAPGDARNAADKFEKVYFHRLGDDQDDDQLIYENKDQPDWTFNPTVSDDGHWLIIVVQRSQDANNLVLYRDLSKPYEEKQPKPPKKKAIVTPGPNIVAKGKSKEPKKHVPTPIETLIGAWNARYQFLGNTKSTLYFLTDLDAPRFRIVAIDLDKPEPGNWKDIVAQAKDTLQSARIVNHILIANYVKVAHSIVSLFDLKGKALGEIALPGVGTASDFTGRTRDAETFYTFTSPAAPPSVYRYDLRLFSGSAWHAPQVAADTGR
jgi:prolyl oligopeptidase